MNETKATMPGDLKCSQCGNPVPIGSPEGLCPACLLCPRPTDSATQPKAVLFEPPTVEALSKLFPQLEILSLIGKGGMGAVYKARQPSLDRLVAVKILPPQIAGGPSSERFSREAKTLARLAHPNIVMIHEFGQAGTLPFFIMEFVDGVNLRQMQRQSRIAPREALAIVAQVCDALQYAHDQGVVHRDIKPENALIDRKGHVKIADFGLAKLVNQEDSNTHLTVSGQTMGTPHYMAPEQVEHPTEVDHRADIFSLGVVFYELLTGELPLGKFPLPSHRVQIDVRLDDVVLRTLEKEPQLRYQSAGEMRSRVETIAHSQSDPPVIPKPVTQTANLQSKTNLLDGRSLAALGSCLLSIPTSLLAGWLGNSTTALLTIFAALNALALTLAISSRKTLLGKFVILLCILFSLGFGTIVSFQQYRAAKIRKEIEQVERAHWKAKLEILTTQAEQLKKQSDLGVVPVIDYEMVKARCDAITARLTNDFLLAAKIEMDAAQKKVEVTKAKFDAGLVPQAMCSKAEKDFEEARANYEMVKIKVSR
jgi:serine/threonine protein kinase